jgi:hypothetical protein
MWNRFAAMPSPSSCVTQFNTFSKTSASACMTRASRKYLPNCVSRAIYSFYFPFSPLSGRLPDGNQLMTKEDIVKIKRCLYSLQRTSMPPVTTHNIVDDWNDPVLNS